MGRLSGAHAGLVGLAREAARLRRAALARWGALRLPALIFVTDPARTPDPAATVARLPPGSGVIFRAFGAPDAERTGLRLARIARDRGLVLLVGADAALAERIGADGVHLPERRLSEAAALRRRHGGWLLTGAAHAPAALRRAEALRLDAALLSPVFASASPSAAGARPWGPVRFARLAQAARLPVYALGGVTARTARRLRGAAGVAAVEGVLAADEG